MSTILVVDDHDDIRRVVRTFLEQEGYKVADAVDTASALRVAKEVLPDAIIMDWALPGGDGLLIARRIRNNVPVLAAVPVIVFTALNVEPAQRRDLVREFGGFVGKIAGSEALLGAVAAVLAKTAFIVHEDEGMRSLLRRLFEGFSFSVKTRPIGDAFRETNLDVRPWRFAVIQGSVAIQEKEQVARLGEVSDRVLVITGGALDLESIRSFCDEILETPAALDHLTRLLSTPQRP